MMQARRWIPKRADRISPAARRLHAALGWPDGWLEYMLVLRSPRGKFVSARRCFLWIDIAHPDQRLAIEIDGSTHRAKKQKRIDAWKARELSKRGWKLLRFSNRQISEGLPAVLATVNGCMTLR